MAIHNSIPAWEIPWTEERSELQSMGLQKIQTQLSTKQQQSYVYNAGDPGSVPRSGRSPGERNGNPLQYSCLENPMDRGV